MRLLILLLFQIILSKSQLENNVQNLLQINQMETFFFYFQDYFYGDGLTYRFNDQLQYFQVNQPFIQGGIEGEVISISPQANTIVQEKQFSILLKINQGDQEKYEIHHLKELSEKKQKPFASQLILKLEVDLCYQINQIDNYIIITCYEFESQEIKYLIYDSQYNLIITYSHKMNDLEKKKKHLIIISKSAGEYLCSLINHGYYEDNEYISNYSNLIIFKFEKININSEIKINLVYQEEIHLQEDFITGFEIVKQGYLFISFYKNSQVQIQDLNNHKLFKISLSISKQILGISAKKISYGSNEYIIVLWNHEELSNFLYDPSQNKIISREKLIQTTQINLLLMFKSDVFINEKYIIVSNLNGISIYPTILNDVNKGRLLYYYSSKPKISYFINIIDYLITIEEQQLVLYIINDPIIKIENLNPNDIPQLFQIMAISNQFDKPQIQCPRLNLYFKVEFDTSIPYAVKSNYFNIPYQVYWSIQNRGIYQGKDENLRYFNINIDCNGKQSIKQKQLIIIPYLKMYPQTPIPDNIDVIVDKDSEVFIHEQDLYLCSDVFYQKQQLIYQHQEIYEFKEKFYLLLQQYFAVYVKECLAKDPNNCVILHYQPIEFLAQIRKFIFNIHDGILYFGFEQNFIWDGYEDLDNFEIQTSNVEIYSYRLNKNKKIIKKIQISHLFFSVIQIDIIDDRLYVLYQYRNDKKYLFNYKIDEIEDDIDIRQHSHLVNFCQNFAFNIEHYGYFLYFFTNEPKDDIIVTYLNAINIEEGKFQQINKLKFKQYEKQNEIRYFEIRITISGVYIQTTSYFEKNIYFKKSDFFLLIFTKFDNQNYERYLNNQINIPQALLFKKQKNRTFKINYFSSEKNLYQIFSEYNIGYIIFVYSFKSTLLNLVHYGLDEYMMNNFDRRAISLLEGDIYSINPFIQSEIKIQKQKLRFIKQEPLITLNCQQYEQTDSSPFVTVPFTVFTSRLTVEQYPVYLLQFYLKQEKDEDNQQNIKD
ncbi:unnamed protein product [Paramecium sonneborni]|uniref:Transmembrane protein n=1 Tax=Paramecium sonneborni TaxID=65129 RepID=A0A8S1P9S9_9CILI|nr:unnamed protein product [Paramecium sonneborni]